jgi:aquaporin Z
MLRKVLVEMIGTFFLVFTIGQVLIAPGAGALAPLAIGAVLTALVYAGGHVSGAHYNPAVTLAIFMRRMMTIAELGAYWVAQLLGAALAVVVVRIFKQDYTAAANQPEVMPALLAEFLFTFVLVYVVLNVATARGNKGNSHYGLAIGFTVMAGAFAVGGVSGGAFNPAVALGVTMLGLVSAKSLWIYLTANLLGGAVAAVVFNVLDLDSDKPTAAKPSDQAGMRPAAEPRA